MIDIYIIIATIYAWSVWSRIQAKMGIAIVTSFNGYIIGQILLCAFTGWFIMPLDIVIRLIRSRKGNKNE